ncbi:MAG: GGDEF domain-containing protein [Clostridia bacterium]|nr:GGDEF domain-containing protein [Clostridia bacterium]
MGTILAVASEVVALIFAAAYPKPLIERHEYLIIYAFLSVTILCFYAVFVLMLQKKKLADLNVQLIKEKQWHKIAYNDALTGMKNRMAYIEQINELERTAKKTDLIRAVMIDIDNFKKINDTHGHYVGDLTLQNAAKLLDTVFSEENYATFRIGGDEFAVIANGVSVEALQERIACLKDSEFCLDVGCSFSIGYSTVDLEQKNAMENAFIRADSAMYEEKRKGKQCMAVEQR